MDSPSPYVFPSNGFSRDGMLLRDYFAAKALTALEGINAHDDLDELAEFCYQIADAMIRASAK